MLLVLLALTAAELPEAPRVAIVEVETAGTKLGARDLRDHALPDDDGIDAVWIGSSSTAQALRACALDPACARAPLPVAAVLLARVAAAGRGCVVTAAWHELPGGTVLGSGARESACALADATRALETAVEEALAEGLAQWSSRRALVQAPDGWCGELPTDEPAMGYLTLDTVPPSNVYVDGVRVGSTPISRERFRAGCLEVVAETPDKARRKTVRVAIRTNLVTRYRFELGPPQGARPRPLPQAVAKRRSKPIDREQVLALLGTMTDRRRARELLVTMAEGGSDERVLARVQAEAMAAQPPASR